MKKPFQLSLATLLLAVAFSANATSADAEVDSSKVCHYAQDIYSPGSRLTQAGKLMSCIKTENGGTRWAEVKEAEKTEES